LYVELRRVLARQPGSEAEEQLRLYESTLKDKRSKLKQMRAELKVYQAKVNELKYEIQKMVQDLKVVKLEYFAKRRRMLQSSRASSRPYGDDASQQGDLPLYEDDLYAGYINNNNSPPAAAGNGATTSITDSKQPLFTPTDKLPAISPRVAASSTPLTLSSVSPSPDNRGARRPLAATTSSASSSSAIVPTTSSSYGNKSFDSPSSGSNDERPSARGRSTDTSLPPAPGSSHGNRPRSSHSSSGSFVLPAAVGASRRPTVTASTSSWQQPAAWTDDEPSTLGPARVGGDAKEEKQRRRPTRPTTNPPLEI
jgi:hypothetical protein